MEDKRIYMDELQALRKKIDEIDQCIVGLLAERFAAAKQVGDYKKARGLEIMQQSREAEVIKNITDKTADDEHSMYILEIYETILKTSKKAQN